MPTRLDTLILGGMLTSVCAWSGIRCPSMISTPLRWQSCLRISPRSLRHWLQMTFLLYFGANTMRYLQSHFVCARPLAFRATAITFPSGLATRAITMLGGRVFCCVAKVGSTRWAGGFVCRAKGARHRVEDPYGSGGGGNTMPPPPFLRLLIESFQLICCFVSNY